MFVFSCSAVTIVTSNANLKQERIYRTTNSVSKSKANLNTVTSPPSKLGLYLDYIGPTNQSTLGRSCHTCRVRSTVSC